MPFVFDIADVTRQFPPTEDGETPDELELFDSVAMEGARLSGDEFKVHPVRVAKNRHPLYKEASSGGGPVYDTAYPIPAAIEFVRESGTTANASNAGLTLTDDAYLWIARKEIDLEGKNLPKVGDVVECWSYQPMGDKRSHSFWDVTLAPTFGDLWSMAIHTMIKLTLKRRTEFSPSEKVIKRG